MATLLTLPAILWAVWQSRSEVGVAGELLEAAAVWALLTAVLALVAWSALLVPLLLVVCPRAWVRWRWAIATVAAATVVGFIGRETGVFRSPEGRPTPRESPWLDRVFWNNSLWAVAFSFTATLRFAQRLGR